MVSDTSLKMIDWRVCSWMYVYRWIRKVIYINILMYVCMYVYRCMCYTSQKDTYVCVYVCLYTDVYAIRPKKPRSDILAFLVELY
jgi:hypothetical protein